MREREKKIIIIILINTKLSDINENMRMINNGKFKATSKKPQEK